MTDLAPPNPTPPSTDNGPHAVADEMFSHGLLHIVHETDGGPRARRVARVMQAMAAPHAPRTSLAPRATHARHRRRFARLWGAGTIITVLAVAFVFLATPTANVSHASIEASISAMRGPGDRRYEVRADFAGPADARRPMGDVPAAAPEREPHAIVDTRPPGLLVLTLHSPEGDTITVGRDAQGEWAIAPDGRINRDNPRRGWPGWAIQDGESIFVDSLDRWLEAFAQSYDLSKSESAPIPGRQGSLCEHIVGLRRPSPPPLIHRLRSADRIEVWIDPTTKLVERMELAWNPPPQGRRGPLPGDRPARGMGDGPRDHEAQWPAPDDAMPRGREPRDPPMDRLEETGPDAGGPDPRRPGPPQRFDDPPRGPRPGPLPGPRGRGDRPGPAADHGPGADGPPPREGPAQPMRKPPLRRLIIERIQTPELRPDWFDPQSHTRK